MADNFHDPKKEVIDDDIPKTPADISRLLPSIIYWEDFNTLNSQVQNTIFTAKEALNIERIIGSPANMVIYSSYR